MQEAESELLSSRHMIDNINSEIQKLVSRIDQYKSLKKELDLYNKKYDEMTLVKEALSSKKGMSLYYIKNYLGNTEDITNELLDIAYNGQIYIDNFKITPTEFTIPFYNRGKLIKDVKYASQGEISFLSIALSFGLASQTLSKYNIMLLDEIDGPLDTTNREKFIKIMENQIERIGSEQSFLITHNDMFSSYPVDVLDLNFDNQEKKYELANYIEIKRI
jgi:DNA repair exonuclease SbcCD ATPase subunit